MLHQEKRYKISSKRKQRCYNNENLIRSYTISVLTELDNLENPGTTTQNSEIPIALKLQEREEDEDTFTGMKPKLLFNNEAYSLHSVYPFNFGCSKWTQYKLVIFGQSNSQQNQT